jgi:hypothetical protein
VFIILIVGTATFFTIVAVSLVRARDCVKSNIASLAAFAAALWTANAAFTWYVNADSHAADRRDAIASAICELRDRGATERKTALKCPSTETMYGYDIRVQSEDVLDATEMARLIEHIRLLKPLLTDGRIHVDFQRIVVTRSDASRSAPPAVHELRSFDTYESIDL